MKHRNAKALVGTQGTAENRRQIVINDDSIVADFPADCNFIKSENPTSAAVTVALDIHRPTGAP